jgi:serine protease AprX
MMYSLRNAASVLILASFTSLIVSAQQHGGKNPKISDDAAVASNAPVHVIIQYNNDPGANQVNTVALHGGSVERAMHSIKAHSVTVAQSELEKLAADPNVKYISVDRPVAARDSAPSGQNVVSTSGEYTTEPINAPQVWAKGYTGLGIGVAVIDSGINASIDFSLLKNSGTGSRIVYSQNFVPGANGVPALSAADQYGHGTHVAGLIAGNGNNSTGAHYFRTFSGSAPYASLINLRVLDANGSGTDSSVIAAIERAIALKNIYNIRIINLSLGRPIWESYTQDPLCQAVEQAWKAGIVVVVAAGNAGRDLNLNGEGYGTIEAPGNDPYAITVGAMNTKGTPVLGDDVIGSYSSKGPSFIDHIAKPDIVAPGNLVTSVKYSNDALALANPTFATLLGFYQSNGNANSVSPAYFPLSGTSMAAGVASGAVALLVQAQPSLTPDQVKAFLMRNADRAYFPQASSVTDAKTGTVYYANYDAFTIGAGYLDVLAALNDVKSGTVVPAGTAMSPVATYDPQTGNTTLVTDQTALWGATVLWGASNVYGANAFVSGDTVLWGATALWGASDPNGFTALWGATVLWGAGTPEAATVLWGAGTTNGQTVLWGAGNSDTVLWGAGGSNTVLWGAGGSDTVLWGASVQYPY